MNRKRLRRSDRLSELPDSIILEILSLLDIRDVVKTSVLSKRWKYLWTTIPCLRFNTRTLDTFVYFVNRILMLWRGAKLRQFGVNVRDFFAPSSHNDMDLWLHFAKEMKVEELYIHLFKASVNLPMYRPSQSLYECSCVRHLSLYNCDLRIPRNLQWDQLKTLMIVGCRFTEGGVIGQVVSSAPQLESFILQFLGVNRDLIIRSSSLKRLQITSNECDPSSHTEFAIWAPKLESLEIAGAPPSKCELRDVSSLSLAVLDVSDKWAAVVGETLSKFITAIKHVGRVKLSACCFKMLGKSSFSPLLNVEHLCISGGPIEPTEIFFGLFPNLKKLIIDWKLETGVDAIAIQEHDEANILISFMSQLTTVGITCYSYNASIFQFIETLLKHAPMIENMELRKKGNGVVESQDMYMAAQKMLSLQRSFPTVQLQMILCKK